MTDEYVDKSEKNFSHYMGKSIDTIINVIFGTVAVVAVGSVLTYGAMTCAYGPYDAGKVMYAEFSRDKSLKHRSVKEAEALFAKRIAKRELNEEDLKSLYLELNVVTSEGKKPTEDDISWYNLLDWIEDND